MNVISHRTLALRASSIIVAGGIVFAACGGSSSTGSSSSTPTTKSSTAGSTNPAAGAPVLPVTANPITNTSTAQALKIQSVLVENNVDSNKKAVPDHLEIALENTGATPLSVFEVFYTFTDTKAETSESYYAKLPSTFTIPAGGKRVAHFDGSGAADHFPVNKFSLYATSKNALKVDVVVSAADAAVQTATIKKDAGGQENAAD